MGGAEMSSPSGAWGVGLERCARLWGIGLYLAAPIVISLSNVVSLGYSLIDVTLFLAVLASGVLAPAGAILFAVSLVVRGLTRGVTSRFVRTQLIAGTGLVVLAVLHVFYANHAVSTAEDYLGATGRAAALFLEPIQVLIGIGALPLGVALLATAPLYQLADVGNSYRDVP